MRITKYQLLVFAITLVLFLIPFFWLKSGEMNLGGDSSRLYFYDPISYIKAQILYNVTSSGVGGDAISYYALPHMLFLAFVRLFLSATLTISLLDSMKLSFSFLFCYFIIKDLLTDNKIFFREAIIHLSAIVGGMFYIFSPSLVNSGWDRAIIIHAQVFLNPLLFFLLLRYFNSKNITYLYSALLVAFIFSPNFSFVGAPAMAAFYPLAFLFLSLYTKFIRGKAIPISGLIFGAILFLCSQAFHIIPHLLSLFFTDNAYKVLFTDPTIFTLGLDYFVAIAPSIKASISLFNLAQVREVSMISFFFVIFPFIIILSFLWNKKKTPRIYGKTLLLSGVFFLIVLFFVSANITDIGFAFYKLLFRVPGFKMFRNFYGQWTPSYIFFYAIFFGQAIAIVLSRVKKIYRYLLVIFVVVILSISSLPLINGSMVNAIHYRTEDVKQTFRMDPVYKDVLTYIRTETIDGKILSFPLVGPGYQVLGGADGGAYMGPSTFSYLAGKNDFTGYDGLQPYSEYFINAVQNEDYKTLYKLIALLNIKYIFYNSDPYIYDSNFPFFPYDYVRDFMPKDQIGYQEFIKHLPLDFDKKVDFGNKYHLYPVQDTVFSPHIYTVTNTVYTTNPFSFPFIFIPYDLDASHSAIYYIGDSHKKDDQVILDAEDQNPLVLLKNNYHLHRHELFISRKLDSIVYPFVLLREQFDLWRKRKVSDTYLDFSFYYLSKRIRELEEWGQSMPIGKKPWSQPKFWQIYFLGVSYNSWEASLVRYEDEMTRLMQWVDHMKAVDQKKWANRIKINEQLLQHQILFAKILKNSQKKVEENTQLLSEVEDMFDRLQRKLNLPLYDTSLYTYKIKIPTIHEGEYEVYADIPKDAQSHIAQAYINVDGRVLRPKLDLQEQNKHLIPFDSISTGNKQELDIALHISPKNLVEDDTWQNSGDISYLKEGMELRIKNSPFDSSGGFTKQMNGWFPKKQYLISFDYITFGDNIRFRIFDKYIKQKNGKPVLGNIYFEKNLKSTTWKTHQSYLSADPKSVSAFIQFTGDQAQTDSRIQIRNLSIVEINDPKIFFKNIGYAQVAQDVATPKITFQKVNPTRYVIQVSGAKNPYSLIFLETYNSNWKLIDFQRESSSAIEKMFSLAGEKLVTVVDVFLKKKKSDVIVGSYFNGNIEEKRGRDTFFDTETPVAWGKVAIAEKSHFRVNGYANAWNIQPQDMNNQENYTLILDMTMQRFFYWILPLSVLTVILIIYLFIKSFLKR